MAFIHRIVLFVDTVPEYSLPFSREVGERTNPTLDAMRAIVVHGRKRPKIPESWKIHEVMHTGIITPLKLQSCSTHTE